ncbi:hypothetical protein McanMca71_002070 [Microsporum canis]
MRSHWGIVVPWIITYTLAECPSVELPLPEEYSDGKFYYPNGSPQCVSKGSHMNVSWASIYGATNLYLIQGENYNSPVGITLNTASTWYDWTVSYSDATNHSAPFVFRIVNARGTKESQQLGGFISGQFYINFGEDSRTSTTMSPTSTLASTTGSSSIPQTTLPSNTSEGERPQKGDDKSHSKSLALGLGIGLGVPFCLTAGAVFFLMRRRAKQSPIISRGYEGQPNNVSHPDKAPEPSGDETVHCDPQELYADSRWSRQGLSHQSQNPHELG